MRGLATYVAKHIDFSHNHPDPEQRVVSDDIVAILTPIVKSFFTERGFLNTSEAMQVCAGLVARQSGPLSSTCATCESQ